MIWVYFLVGLVSLTIAVMLAGVKRVFDPRRLIGWYFVVFALTYLLRPLPADVHARSDVYDQLDIQGFSAVPVEMTIAVSISLLCLAAGYRLGKRRVATVDAPVPGPRLRKKLIYLAVALIAWGYLSSVLFPASGALENLSDRQYGVNTGRTAWLTESIAFASTGTILLYLLNGRLFVSIALAVPWFVVRQTGGWTRVNVIAHLAALICLMFIRWRKEFAFKVMAQAAVLAVAVAFTVLVFFPAAGSVRAGGGNFRDFSAQELTEVFLRNFDPKEIRQTSRELSGFEATAYMLEVNHPPTWGLYYAYFYFIKPIPRTVWPAKPLPPDLAEWILGVPEDVKYFGLAGGAIGDALFAWGWMGIPLEFLLTGWAFRRLESTAVERQPSASALLAYAGFFSLLPQLGRDSLIHMISERWLFMYGIPVFLLWYVADRRNPSSVAAVSADGSSRTRMRPLVGQP